MTGLELAGVIGLAGFIASLVLGAVFALLILLDSDVAELAAFLSVIAVLVAIGGGSTAFALWVLA